MRGCYDRRMEANATTDILEVTSGVLSTTPARWRALVEATPRELLERAPEPGEWSAADCLRHLVTVERILLRVRLRHFLEGRPELVPFDPEAPREPDPEGSPRELLALLEAERAETLALLAGLSTADLERTAHHPEYHEDITLRQHLNVWAAHDLQHTVQAEEALMQAFIPSTGPWRGEFATHDVERRAMR